MACSDTGPKNLKELGQILNKVFAKDAVNVESVQKLMESYTGEDWKTYSMFARDRYTRNLVGEGNGKYNLLVLCWNTSQGSPIHSHAGSHCFLRVLGGEVKEEIYEWPDNEGGKMSKRRELTYGGGTCTYIADTVGLHRVSNPSDSVKAVTLHLYSPPYSECFKFDESNGHRETANVTYWSKDGKPLDESDAQQGNYYY